MFVKKAADFKRLKVCTTLLVTRHWVLERELQRKLDQTRVVHGGVNCSEACRVYVYNGNIKLWMIPQIEEFSPELQEHTLAEGKSKVLDGREIRVHEPRSGHRGTRGEAELADWWKHEAALIEEL